MPWWSVTGAQLKPTANPNSSLLTLQAVQEIRDRFSFTVGTTDTRQILLRAADKRASLDDTIFNFGDDTELARLLRPRGWLLNGECTHKTNSIHIYQWLITRLAKASAVAAKQAEWLLQFLEAFCYRVHWTTSLTVSSNLALQTFLNVNRDSHRVPLKEVDVIKVALVSDVDREVRLRLQWALLNMKSGLPEHALAWPCCCMMDNCLTACRPSSIFSQRNKVGPALRRWKDCIDLLDRCAAQVAQLAGTDGMPYLLFLGSSKMQRVCRNELQLRDALQLDCLASVRAIRVRHSAGGQCCQSDEALQLCSMSLLSPAFDP